MPYVLRGILDDILEEINANRSRNPVQDPMPKMIEVWQQYNEWCNKITRLQFTMRELNDIRGVTLALTSNIKAVFPVKHGPMGRQGAWRLSKFHDTARHFERSIVLFGSLQVRSITQEFLSFLSMIIWQPMTDGGACGLCVVVLMSPQNSGCQTGESCHVVHTGVYSQLTNRQKGWEYQMLRGLSMKYASKSLRYLIYGVCRPCTLHCNR